MFAGLLLFATLVSATLVNAFDEDSTLCSDRCLDGKNQLVARACHGSACPDDLFRRLFVLNPFSRASEGTKRLREVAFVRLGRPDSGRSERPEFVRIGRSEGESEGWNEGLDAKRRRRHSISSPSRNLLTSPIQQEVSTNGNKGITDTSNPTRASHNLRKGNKAPLCENSIRSTSRKDDANESDLIAETKNAEEKGRDFGEKNNQKRTSTAFIRLGRNKIGQVRKEE